MPYLDSLSQGKAAEHLVCADLIACGVEAYLSDQGLAYDVVADLGRAGLLRVQVKSTLSPRNMNSAGKNPSYGYTFSARRKGKNGYGRLTDRDADMFAFVGLDIGAIAYFPVEGIGQTVNLMTEDHDFNNGYVRAHNAPITHWPFASALEKWKALKCLKN